MTFNRALQEMYGFSGAIIAQLQFSELSHLRRWVYEEMINYINHKDSIIYQTSILCYLG